MRVFSHSQRDIDMTARKPKPGPTYSPTHVDKSMTFHNLHMEGLGNDPRFDALKALANASAGHAAALVEIAKAFGVGPTTGPIGINITQAKD
jgi:hypothetical protein